MKAAVDGGALPLPPADLLNDASLFIDFDGTLVDLIDQPDQVVADDALIALLARLLDRRAAGLALVSGRSIEQLDRMLGPIAQRIALSGSHGCEHRWNGILAHPVRPAALDDVEGRLKGFAGAHPGVVIEPKSFGVALHYRHAPAAEIAAHEQARLLGEMFGLAVQPGKMVVELRVPGGDKGAAVRRMMGRPIMAGTKPIFIGDDWTDEAGFQAASDLGGFGVLVGPLRETAALYGLPDSAAVRAWLSGQGA